MRLEGATRFKLKDSSHPLDQSGEALLRHFSAGKLIRKLEKFCQIPVLGVVEKAIKDAGDEGIACSNGTFEEEFDVSKATQNSVQEFGQIQLTQ